MSALSAVQSLVVMLLWLYIGRIMLGRWINDPAGVDLEPIGNGVSRQTHEHQRRQIAATLAYWMVAACCFWLAVLHLLPEQPDAATKSHQAEQHANDARDSGIAWMPSEDSTRHDLLAVLVVDPLTHTYGAGADGQPDQRLAQRRVIAYGHNAYQHGAGDEWQRPIPLVGPESLTCVHVFSQSLLIGNAFHAGGRP